MKVIDLINKISNDELEDLTHIKNIEHDCEYIYHKKDCRFEFVKKGIWEDYFYKFDISELNDEIEIIEEPKEELEELEEIDKIQYYYKNTYGNISQHKKSETDIIDKINELIENQNNMIKKIKEVKK